MSHQDLQSYSELIEKLADLALEKLDPEKKPTSPARSNPESRAASTSDRRVTWKRAQGQCEFHTHNRLRAIQAYGSKTMSRYLK